MFRTKSGEEIFIIDGHMHLWDASPENVLNKYGQGFIDCFYAYHANLSPPEYVWDEATYANYGADRMLKDVFETDTLTWGSSSQLTLLTSTKTVLTPLSRTRS